MEQDPNTVRVTVSDLKHALGVGGNIRLIIEPDSNSTVIEKPSILPPSPPSPPSTNNVFMNRNIRVREWNGFSREEETNNSVDAVPRRQLWEEVEDEDTNYGAAKNKEKATTTPSELLAKQSAAVDTLKKKLEMKKASSKEDEEMTSNGWTKVQIRTGGVRRFSAEENVQEGGGTGGKAVTMVTMSPSGPPSARVNMTSLDRGREDYMKQFSERTRPISEASPIKTQLENIYNNGKVGSHHTSTPSKVGSHHTSTPSKEIVFTTQSQEDEQRAKKTIAMALAKKKQAEGQRKIDEEMEAMTDTIPVPVKRTSIKKKTEYMEVNSSGGSTKPSITIGDFTSSETDYRSIKKTWQQQ